MGIDYGFDMVPPLSNNERDNLKWKEFLTAIKNFFQGDESVEIKENLIEFNVGEHPVIPFEGHKLLRFSSKISGRSTAEPYIKSVIKLAEAQFGQQVWSWHEGYDQWGFYDWSEVNDSFKSYEKPSSGKMSLSAQSSQRLKDLSSQSDSTVKLASEISEPVGKHNIDANPSIDILSASKLPNNCFIPCEQLYVIKAVQGRGLGLIALKDIEKGTRILCEAALLTTAGISAASEIEYSIAGKLKCLAKEQQRQFLSLYNDSPGKQPFTGIIRTNALPLGSGSRIGGIFPIASRINHSCRPNTQHTWNSTIEKETIHAIRNIKRDEEITISYSLGGPSQERRKNLKDSFGFDCTCDLCSLTGEALKTSDRNESMITLLDDSIGNSNGIMGSPGSVLKMCYELLTIYKSELITDARVARVYYDAFQVCITHGDLARASVFAQKAYETRLYLEGDDSPETRKMKSFTETPSAHMSFGFSDRWETSKDDAPRTVDTEDFEKWLWQPANSEENDSDIGGSPDSDISCRTQ